VLGVGVACRKPAKVVLTKDQRTRIEENLLKTPPTPKVPLGIQFGDGIKLLGVDVAPEHVKPGETLTITWYWECTKATPGEWKVFGHLELPAGKRMILDHTPVGELYPIAQWKAGELIRDVQKIVIEADSKDGPAVLWAGIFNEEIYRERGSGDRMPIVNKDKVTSDGDNRARIAQVTVTAGAAASKAAVLKAFRTATPPVIDGKLDDEAWKAAAESAPFQKAAGGAADPADATTVRALYDDRNLYIAFHVLDPMIEATFRNRDDELWTQDAVEIYLDPGSDGADYVELQVSPANVVFDAQFKTHRTPDWKEAKAWNLAGLQTAVAVNGTLNDPADKDVGYDVEVLVPFASLAGFDKVPPDVGTTMTVNFFRMDARQGKIAGAFAFSPAGGDFHDLSKAGTLEFAGVPGAAPAAATGAAGLVQGQGLPGRPAGNSLAPGHLIPRHPMQPPPQQRSLPLR
jgi:hypothetical protein